MYSLIRHVPYVLEPAPGAHPCVRSGDDDVATSEREEDAIFYLCRVTWKYRWYARRTPGARVQVLTPYEMRTALLLSLYLPGTL